VERRLTRHSALGRVDVLEWTREPVVNVLVHGDVAATLANALKQETE
jgi:hypothetical protein